MTEDEQLRAWQDQQSQAISWAGQVVANLGYKQGVIYQLERIRLEIAELQKPE